MLWNWIQKILGYCGYRYYLAAEGSWFDYLFERLILYFWQILLSKHEIYMFLYIYKFVCVCVCVCVWCVCVCVSKHLFLSNNTYFAQSQDIYNCKYLQLFHFLNKTTFFTTFTKSFQYTIFIYTSECQLIKPTTVFF